MTTQPMEVNKVASYLLSRFREEYKETMDEMKLHKLLYFTQRESYVLKGEPIFAERFEAWKYGPVMVQIREGYKTGTLTDLPSEQEIKPYKEVFDSVFEKYAHKSSWTLSMLTHDEISWKNARGECPMYESCSSLLRNEDIAKDAQVIKMRRFYFNNVLPQLHENHKRTK